MKKLLLTASVGLALFSLGGQAIGACAGPSVRVNLITDMNALLTGNTVCSPAVTQATMTWQELHQAGGDLVDYKRGPPPAEKVDPSEKVGTWSVTGAGGARALVTHNYGSGGTFTYLVWNNGNGTHSFCSSVGNQEIVTRVKTGGGAC